MKFVCTHKWHKSSYLVFKFKVLYVSEASSCEWASIEVLWNKGRVQVLQHDRSIPEHLCEDASPYMLVSLLEILKGGIIMVRLPPKEPKEDRTFSIIYQNKNLNWTNLIETNLTIQMKIICMVVVIFHLCTLS
jgi:hypothetical protein